MKRHYEVTDVAGRVWEWEEDERGNGTPWSADQPFYVYIDGKKDDVGIVARTVELGRGVQVDYAADGSVFGIEFI